VRVQLHVNAETHGFVDEDAVVVRAVDVQVWRAVRLFGVWENVLGGENFAFFIASKDEIVRADRGGFDFVEDTPAAEDVRRVWGDLDSSADLASLVRVWQLGGKREHTSPN
jgi:hypothetical protein